MSTSQRLLLVGLACLVVAMAQPAYAYIDPSIGPLVFQAVIGVFAVVMLAFRKRWNEFKRFVGRIFSSFRSSKTDD